MKQMKRLLAIVLLFAAGFAMASPKHTDFTVVNDSGIVDGGRSHAISDFFILTGGHSKWYDVTDLTKSKNVAIDLFECTRRRCNSLRDYSFVTALSYGQSFKINAALPNNGRWLAEVVSTACNGMNSYYHFKVTSVPEPETIVLMLLGVLFIGLKARSRKTSSTLGKLA